MKTAVRFAVVCASLFALQACSRQSRPAPAPLAPTPAAPVKPAPVAEPAPVAKAAEDKPCPPDEQLRGFLAKAWKVDASAIDDLTCTPGHFPRAGFAVFTFLADPDDDMNMFSRLAILDVDGKPVAGLDGEPQKERLETTAEITKLAAADLDGDGTDELVATMSSSYKLSPTTESVVVYRIQGKALAQPLVRGYAYETSEDLEDGGVALCQGSYQLTTGTPLQLRITGKILHRLPKVAKGADRPECVSGSEIYVLRGDAMVKQ